MGALPRRTWTLPVSNENLMVHAANSAAAPAGRNTLLTRFAPASFCIEGSRPPLRAREFRGQKRSRPCTRAFTGAQRVPGQHRRIRGYPLRSKPGDLGDH